MSYSTMAYSPMGSSSTYYSTQRLQNSQVGVRDVATSNRVVNPDVQYNLHAVAIPGCELWLGEYQVGTFLFGVPAGSFHDPTAVYVLNVAQLNYLYALIAAADAGVPDVGNKLPSCFRGDLFNNALYKSVFPAGFLVNSPKETTGTVPYESAANLIRPRVLTMRTKSTTPMINYWGAGGNKNMHLFFQFSINCIGVEGLAGKKYSLGLNNEVSCPDIPKGTVGKFIMQVFPAVNKDRHIHDQSVHRKPNDTMFDAWWVYVGECLRRRDGVTPDRNSGTTIPDGCNTERDAYARKNIDVNIDVKVIYNHMWLQYLNKNSIFVSSFICSYGLHDQAKKIFMKNYKSLDQIKKAAKMVLQIADFAIQGGDYTTKLSNIYAAGDEDDVAEIVKLYINNGNYEQYIIQLNEYIKNTKGFEKNATQFKMVCAMIAGANMGIFYAVEGLLTIFDTGTEIGRQAPVAGGGMAATVPASNSSTSTSRTPAGASDTLLNKLDLTPGTAVGDRARLRRADQPFSEEEEEEEQYAYTATSGLVPATTISESSNRGVISDNEEETGNINSEDDEDEDE